jgi:hypothetical protein
MQIFYRIPLATSLGLIQKQTSLQPINIYVLRSAETDGLKLQIPLPDNPTNLLPRVNIRNKEIVQKPCMDPLILHWQGHLQSLYKPLNQIEKGRTTGGLGKMYVLALRLV